MGQMKTKYHRSVLVIAYMVAAFVFSQKSSTIIATGSVHAQLDPCGWPKKPLGGLSRKYSAVKDLQYEGVYPLILDAGDILFSAEVIKKSDYDAELFRASTILGLYEKIGCDVINIGHYEFASGYENLRKLVDGT